MAIRADRSATDWLMLSGLVVFWGSSFALTKIAVVTLAPEWTVAVRLTFGAAIVTILMLHQGHRLPRDAVSLVWLGGLGIIGSVLPFYLISWGMQFIDSGLAGILMAAVPLAVITLAHLFLPDEPLTWPKSAGFAIGFAGVIMVIGPSALFGFEARGIALLAQLAILAATFSYAATTVLARRSPAMDPLQKTSGVLIAGAFSAIVLALLLNPSGLSDVSLASLGAALMLGIFPTGIAGIMLFALLDRAGAGFVSISNYLMSPFAYLLGVVALGEAFEWRVTLGLAVILAGIAIAEMWRNGR